jgi:hypothetical protein
MKLIEDFIIFRENPNERKNVNEYFIMETEPGRFIPATYIFSYWGNSGAKNERRT